METAMYLENPSVWTDEPAQARKFGGAMDALFHCYAHKLRNVEIQGRDFSIPLRDIESGKQKQLAK
jgi:hypothetical protein